MIIIVRDSKVKLTLPKPEIKKDGTIWQSGMPVLGITDPAEKAKAAAAVKSKKFSNIPAGLFTRLGDNPNGLWAGTPEEWAKHPAKLEADKIEEAKELERSKQVTIYLSSRGWGDYSPCEWRGNITRPDAEILTECRKALEAGYDVDLANQTDEELLTKIRDARSAWESTPAQKAMLKKMEEEDIQQKIRTGYCFSCESYCYGDCGHFSSDPKSAEREKK